MKKLVCVFALVTVGCALSNVDVTRAPGAHTPAPADPSPTVVHDPPAASTVLAELGRVRVQQNAFGSGAECEAKALEAARAKLGGGVFYVHNVDTATLGLSGNPCCEAVAYTRR